jgi:hypothetical protein
MDVMTKKFTTLIAAGLLMAGLAHATPTTILDVNFGSLNDEFGGFTASVEDTNDDGSWTEQTNSIRYSILGGSGNNLNASLMREFSGGNALSTAAGSSYTFTTVIDSTGAGNNNRNNRIALSMFANTDTASALNNTGIVVKLLQASNAMSFQINRGLNDFTQTKQEAWGGAALGSGKFTFSSTVSFTATDANISFTVTDSSNFSDTMTHTIALTDLVLGDFHGVAARARTRGDTTNVAFTMDVESFSIIPEPSVIGLFIGAIAFALVINRRRRK